MSIMKKLKLFTRDESGASMVEYGVALIVVVTVGVVAMSGLGTPTRAKVDAACTALGVRHLPLTRRFGAPPVARARPP